MRREEGRTAAAEGIVNYLAWAASGYYRVQFYVSGGVVIVEKIGHRDGFYED